MIYLILILCFVIWFPYFLIQIIGLNLTNNVRKLYELESLGRKKNLYNYLMASLWFLWIWFPIRENIYYDK